MIKTTAVVLAAGESRRMGGLNKQLATMGDFPVIYHSLAAFERAEEINDVIIVAQASDIEDIKRVTLEHNLFKVKHILPGGKTRYESAKIGCEGIPSGIVLIHDGARPLITSAKIDEVASAAREHGACVLAVPVTETVKIAEFVGGGGLKVRLTPDRRVLYTAQTPQAFDIKIYRAALAAHAESDSETVTDDATMVERAGTPVHIVTGDDDNIKITHMKDLAIAELLMLMREGTAV